jgi:hypothetical protein
VQVALPGDLQKHAAGFPLVIRAQAAGMGAVQVFPVPDFRDISDPLCDGNMIAPDRGGEKPVRRALFYHENRSLRLDMTGRDPFQADRTDRKGAADDVSAGAPGHFDLVSSIGIQILHI